MLAKKSHLGVPSFYCHCSTFAPNDAASNILLSFETSRPTPAYTLAQACSGQELMRTCMHSRKSSPRLSRPSAIACDGAIPRKSSAQT